MSATATATKTLMEIRDLQVHFALHETLQVAPHRPRRAARSRPSTASRSTCARARSSASSASPARARRRSAARCSASCARRAAASSCAARSSPGCRSAQLRPKRRHLQMVFQDPHASLNPAHDAGDRARASAADPQADQGRRRDQGQGPRGARARQPVAGRPVRLPAAGRSLGRPEAARGDRAGDHHRPRPGRRRRADLDARHERAGEDPRPDDRPQEPARADVRLRHPRPRVGQVLLRPRGDHVPRPDRRDRDRRADLQRAQAPVHAGADPRDPGAGPGQGAPARPAARRGARRGVAAAGLLVPPALPAGLRALRLGDPRPARRSSTSAGRTRARRPTPPSAGCSATSRSSRSATRRSSRRARAATRASW